MTLEITDEPVLGITVEDARVGHVALDDAPLGAVTLLDLLLGPEAGVEGAIVAGGAMIRTRKQTFTDADFADVDGSSVATFDTPLPPGALVLGSLIEVLEPMGAPVQSLLVRPALGMTPCGNISSAQLQAVGRYPSLAQEGGTFDATAPVFPTVDTSTDISTDGEIAVTIFYIDPGAPELKQIIETFGFADFVDIDPPNGNYCATFAGSLPLGAVPVGAVLDITQAFEAGVFLTAVDDAVVGHGLAGAVAGDSIKKSTGNAAVSDYILGPGTHPLVQIGGQATAPVSGVVEVTLYYLDTVGA
jgi:hypothetical protein